MTDIESCKQTLGDYFYQQIHIKHQNNFTDEEIIKTLKDIWKDDYVYCNQSMGRIVGIKKFVEQIKSSKDGVVYNNNASTGATLSGEKVHGAATTQTLTDETQTYEENDTNQYSTGVEKTYEVENEDSTGLGSVKQNVENKDVKDLLSSQKKTQSTGFMGYTNFTDFKNDAIDFGSRTLLIVVLFFLIRFLLVFFYDVMNSHRMQFFRVILPRGDSKMDRDREKEISKDMKEKIGRMAQVFRNMHKLGHTNIVEDLMSFIFKKAKISLILHYEKGKINFIIGTYPEYRRTIEGAISAQYPEASIELWARPNFFSKKDLEIIPMQTTKDNVYPIRIFKQLEDDPINNVIDSVGKIASQDTFSIVLTIKPASQKFNARAQKMADGLFKKDEAVLNKLKWWKRIFFFWHWFDFLMYGPSQKLIKTFAPGASQGDPFIRMVKAEEEALNTIGEEAGKPAFEAGLMLISSSDDYQRALDNRDNVISAYSIYRDEYNNGLDQPEWIADAFGFIIKPLRKFATQQLLVRFLYKKATFTVNELASLYHFPDGTFNRSPVISWMDYKVLATPDGLPVLKDETKFRISGKIAEDFRGGDVSKIYSDVKHRAVGEKIEETEDLFPTEHFTKEELEGAEIIEKDGKAFVKAVTENKKVALKVFRDGTLLGINSYRNIFTPIYMKKKDRSRHHYIIGKSGGGKSVYISSLARQDIWNGDGICVIDPHGDLVEDILKYIPKDRAKDVIYFDAGNEERPMGLNLYEIDSINQADRVVNDATEIFLKMFGSEIFGPRIQEYFKYGSLTLLEDMEDGATLIDVPRLFTDEIYREYKIKKVKNPVVRNFWERTYNAMGDREKQEIIPYFTSKFVSFITNRLIRNIIGQTKSAFRFREAMDEGKILLVNLSKGKIGELNAQLLGMVLVSQIYNAAMSRADVPEDQRRDFYLYVDEFQNFVTGTFADILSEARKYHLGLIMAHQYIAQLEDKKAEGGKSDVKKAVFGNVGTMQSFKVGAEDAEFLEKEYSPVLSAQDIIGISNFKVYIKLNINNSTSRVFSMDTIWTEDYKNDKVAEILKEYSGKKYGRKKEFVEAEIAARLGMLEDEDADSQEMLQAQESET